MPYVGPGSGRRWEPEMGVKIHNERIHRESKFADDHKNLPFEFSKPIKHRKSVDISCSKCGRGASVPKNTIGMICPSCNCYVSVEPESENKEASGNGGKEG